MSSKIPYVDETINPWVGCMKIRPGCLNCYAERLAYRLAAMGQVGYQIALDGRQWSGQIAYQMEQLEKLKHWHKPRRIFIGSMTDVFYEKMPFESIQRLFEIMEKFDWHTFLILTKRIERAFKFYQWCHARFLSGPLPPNVHLLISCSTQKDLDEMAPVLFQIPAAVRGVSAEPLLSDLDLGRYIGGWDEDDHCKKCGLAKEENMDICDCPSGFGPKFDHIIVGCEKLAGNRPGRFCEDEARWWQAARNIKEQCKAVGVAFYMKQGCIDGKVVSEISKFPKDLQVREYPHV